MIIKLQYKCPAWHQNENCFVLGHAFLPDGNLLLGDNFLNFFALINSEKELKAALQTLNGQFSVIINKPEFCAIAIDSTRSFPLFYRISDTKISVSDNANELIQAGDELNTNAISQVRTGLFIIGNQTLVNGIYQVKPSTYVIFEKNAAKSDYHTQYVIPQNEIFSNNDHSIELVEKINKSCDRLIKTANGRQIIIPLSGGYDSRLIACLLKKANYTNVICYNVGRRDNPEHKISKLVAESLNFPYYFIDNTSSDFLNNYTESSTFKNYYNYSGMLCGPFWMYEYFGVKYLVEEKIIEANAIFVPGHSGDVIAGSQLTKAGINKNNTIAEIIEKAFANKYSGGDTELKNLIGKFMLAQMEKNPDVLPYMFYDEFDYLERLPSYINNSARVYHFFEHEFRLLFWDKELMNFMNSLAFEQKEYKKMYNKVLEERYFKPLNVFYKKETANYKTQIYWKRIKTLIKKLLPKAIAKEINRTPDHTCMFEITQAFTKELVANKIELNKSLNNRFTEWYILQLKKKL